MTKNDKSKRRAGRPAVERPMRQIAIRLTDELLRDIDAVIEDRAGQSERATVIREAIAKGLRQMSH